MFKNKTFSGASFMRNLCLNIMTIIFFCVIGSYSEVAIILILGLVVVLIFVRSDTCCFQLPEIFLSKLPC